MILPSSANGAPPSSKPLTISSASVSALKEAVAYAQIRQTMGKPIAQHQAIQLKLGEMAAKTRAAELLVEDAARAYDKGGRVDLSARWSIGAGLGEGDAGRH